METRSTLCAHSAQIRRAVGALGAWGGEWPSFGEGVRVSGRVRSAAGGAADGAGAGRRYGKPVIHLAVSQFSQPSSQNIPPPKPDTAFPALSSSTLHLPWNRAQNPNTADCPSRP